ncbi:unnamed protein product [Effrenium voratum]|nr:unnamed protein product [Effrenium voratum]
MERHLSRWLAGIMAEDQHQLLQVQEEQRRARNDEAFESWKRRKAATPTRKQECESRRRSRPRASREQCEQHYEAWCRRYDAKRPEGSARELHKEPPDAIRELSKPHACEQARYVAVSFEH